MTDIRDLGRAALATTGLPLVSVMPVGAGVLAVCQLLLFCLGAVPVRAADKPSIILILTDDQTVSLADHMPNLRQLVAGKGATFTHAYYNDPLCGPSRATILTGRYSQNTGVDQNRYAPFVPHERETVAVALHEAGYRTALVGKYINGY